MLKSLVWDERENYRRLLSEDKQALDAELDRHGQFHSALELVKTLPVKYQEVIALKYFEGYPLSEIGAILGKKEGTIKSLLSRGLKKLRGRLQPKTNL